MFDARIADKAMGIVVPVGEDMMGAEICKRQDLAMRLGRRKTDGTAVENMILSTHDIGDWRMWEYPFAAIATGKFAVTARTGLPTREVHLYYPELLKSGDVMYWGSWIDGDIIAACSGIEPWFDEMVSKMLVAAAKALTEHALIGRLDTLEAENPNAIYFNGKQALSFSA